MFVDEGAGAPIPVPVVLSYRMEKADAAAAVRTAFGRSAVTRVLYSPALLVPLLVLGLGLDAWWLSHGGGNFFAGFFIPAWSGLMLWVRRLSVHKTLKVGTRLGDVRVVVDDSGLWTKSELADERHPWTAYREWRETDAAFVLVGHKEARIFQVLPKRALADADEVGRLRGLLAAHLAAA